MFNIRVYGLLIQQNKILLCEEIIHGNKIIKFPGGGLEFGEGTINCLKREFKEELGIEISDISHFYTTDFFVESIFRSTDQVISIYYKVVYEDLIDLSKYNTSEINFFWKELNELNVEDVTLPIDKVVVELLASSY